jgi:NADH-quinone oxidoreductase subunit J
MTVLFFMAAAVAVIATALVVTTRKTVHALIHLVVSFLALALVFYVLGAPFVAALEVIIYAGAIMVLFLFVIMMLQGPVLEGEFRRMKPALWPAVAIPPLAVVVLVGTRIADHGTAAFTAPLPDGFGSPTHVAELLLGRYLLAFELVSIALLVAIIGALAIGKEERKLPWK